MHKSRIYDPDGDLVLECPSSTDPGGQEVVHIRLFRGLLCAHSVVFRNMFKDAHREESGVEKVSVDDKAEDLEMVADALLHLGNFQITPTNFLPLLRTSDKYEIASITTSVCNWIRSMSTLGAFTIPYGSSAYTPPPLPRMRTGSARYLQQQPVVRMDPLETFLAVDRHVTDRVVADPVLGCLGESCLDAMVRVSGRDGEGEGEEVDTKAGEFVRCVDGMTKGGRAVVLERVFRRVCRQVGEFD